MSTTVNNATNIAIGIVFAAIPVTTFADNSEGTGRQQPTIQLNISADQRAILSLSDEQQLVVGSGTLHQGYSELSLDAFGTQDTQSDWGHAEVLLGCHQADVLVYQNIDGQAVEVFASQIATDSCAQ